MKNYIRFAIMILTSTVIMYFLMYLNVFEISHATFSETRLYMALIMGSVMAIVMLLFMWKMYKNKRANAIILAVAAVTFGASLWLVRSQTLVDDTSWMSAMIPHHSIAILTSERANLTNPEVQELADEIIEAQKREIDEMKELIEEIEAEEE
ncbi:DUF305 domain-containing protein [Lacticigenium naphthae]|uniref:DUF305 domain-containing protein n=1 Tax=Lacticigenium naphthae TaxID=515351 RepID=UPI0004810A97|nr:DUF305 domain-containing protein [Lacticigenium naphthae]